MFDINEVRKEYPITQQCFTVYGCDVPCKLIYFDHGASTHCPNRVLNKYIDFIKYYYSNVHRGKHFLSMISSELFDNVYHTIFNFIHADKEANEVVLTSNTTTALDIASSIMSAQEGITLVSLMEHHSNDLPHRKRSGVVHFGLNPDGTIDMNDLERKLKANKVKLVAVTGASNLTGSMPEIHKIAGMAHQYGAKILVDAAQILAHRSIDVKPNDDLEHIDFLAAAGHKAYAPFGSAFLFGPRDLMDEAEPYIPGGGTVIYVTEDDVLFDKSPARHQGGTPNIAGAIALAESMNFLTDIGMDNIREHEIELTHHALEKFREVPGLELLGDVPIDKRLGVVTFNISGLNHSLVSTILNYESAIATRNGCFCAHPYMAFLLGISDNEQYKEMLLHGDKSDLPGAVRLSLGIYNTKDEIDEFVKALIRISAREWKADYSSYVPTTVDCKQAVSGNIQV